MGGWRWDEMDWLRSSGVGSTGDGGSEGTEGTAVRRAMEGSKIRWKGRTSPPTLHVKWWRDVWRCDRRLLNKLSGRGDTMPP